jgi:hypothetical protein
MESISRPEAERLLAMEEADLYLLLLPPEAATDLYTREGKLARAQEIFRSQLKRVRGAVCAKYAEHKDTTKSTIDLLALIALTIGNTLDLGPTTVYAMAALILKIGIGELCNSPRPEKT